MYPLREFIFPFTLFINILSLNKAGDWPEGRELYRETTSSELLASNTCNALWQYLRSEYRKLGSNPEHTISLT